jgi:hypothetical protein
LWLTRSPRSRGGAREIPSVLLSGRIETQAIAELKRLFALQPDYRCIVIDLKDVGVVDHDLMRFLAGCEEDGRSLKTALPIFANGWREKKIESGIDAVVTHFSSSQSGVPMRGTYMEQAARDKEIGRRAYEIYLERGEVPGLELDDWLQAERELAAEVLSHAQGGLGSGTPWVDER